MTSAQRSTPSSRRFYNTNSPSSGADSTRQWSTNFLTERKQQVRLGRRKKIQHPDHQHWRPPGMCALPTALLPLHLRVPVCFLLRFAGRHSGHRPHRERWRVCRREDEQLVLWCGYNSLELNKPKTRLCGGDLQVSGNHNLSGPEVGRQHHQEKGQVEVVLPAPAQEVQPADLVLLRHHPVCALSRHHCVFWIGHQARQRRTPTGGQVCRENYWLQPALHPGLVHLQSQKAGWKHHCRSFTSRTQAVPTPPLWLALQSTVCQKPPDTGTASAHWPSLWWTVNHTRSQNCTITTFFCTNIHIHCSFILYTYLCCYSVVSNFFLYIYPVICKCINYMYVWQKCK